MGEIKMHTQCLQENVVGREVKGMLGKSKMLQKYLRKTDYEDCLAQNECRTFEVPYPSA
jgi:hypothetical protein